MLHKLPGPYNITSTSHKKEVPDLLRAATLDLNRLYSLTRSFVLHSGEMYPMVKPGDHTIGPFSFIPCKPGRNGASGFPRPMLDYNRFRLLEIKLGTIHKLDSSDIYSYWQNIVNHVLKQGYSLGVSVDLPSVMSVEKCKIGLGSL
jgi:hypothetical protein